MVLSCELCSSSFPVKLSLHKHINAIHEKIRHPFERCEKVILQNKIWLFMYREFMKETSFLVNIAILFSCRKWDWKNILNQSIYLFLIKSVKRPFICVIFKILNLNHKCSVASRILQLCVLYSSNAATQLRHTVPASKSSVLFPII